MNYISHYTGFVYSVFYGINIYAFIEICVVIGGGFVHVGDEYIIQCNRMTGFLKLTKVYAGMEFFRF